MIRRAAPPVSIQNEYSEKPEIRSTSALVSTPATIATKEIPNVVLVGGVKRISASVR